MIEPLIPENKALADALLHSVVLNTRPVQAVEDHIVMLGELMAGDTIERQGTASTKTGHTIAALLTYSSDFRRFAVEKGVNLAQFDRDIAMLRNEWQRITNKQPSGLKFASVLKRLVGL